MDQIQLRTEHGGDQPAIAHVNQAAFGQDDESRIVQAIREAGHANISLVAATDSQIVGHILFTPIAVESASSTRVMGLAPLAVLPEWQRRGVGSSLVREGLTRCAQSGCDAVVVVGHPQYYPRFGFRPASAYGLRCEFPVADDVFMAIELVPGALGNCRGLVRYLPEFGS
jgi:putative acetyltransferase